jgi:hypothetical protein
VYLLHQQVERLFCRSVRPPAKVVLRQQSKCLGRIGQPPRNQCLESLASRLQQRYRPLRLWFGVVRLVRLAQDDDHGRTPPLRYILQVLKVLRNATFPGIHHFPRIYVNRKAYVYDCSTLLHVATCCATVLQLCVFLLATCLSTFRPLLQSQRANKRVSVLGCMEMQRTSGTRWGLALDLVAYIRYGFLCPL